MKRSDLNKLERGTAAYVVAHAKWRRSRGRQPTMPYLHHKESRAALRVATLVVNEVARQNAAAQLVATVLSPRHYSKMSDKELKWAVRRIITTSHSEEEAQRRVTNELGYPSTGFDIESRLPNDAAGREARDLVAALGGMVMASGAMAMGSIVSSGGRTIFL